MAYPYSYPTSYGVYGYPPRLYAHEPSLSNNNDSEAMGMIPEAAILVFPTSGSAIDPLVDPDPAPRPSHLETEDYLRRTLDIPMPRPVNLWALPDSRKPTISEMARLAIWGSPEKRLTLAQIFEAIETRYPQMAHGDDKPWRRSLRHHLSLKNIFEQDKRPNDHPGKGDYWVLNVRHGETSRKSRQDTASGSQDDFQLDLSPDSEGSESTSLPPSTTSSPQQGFYLPYHTESPRPDMMLPSTSDRDQQSMVERVGHLTVDHPGAVHAYHHQPPPDTVNPMMTMGGYRDDDMQLGPSIQRLSHRETWQFNPPAAHSSSRHDAPVQRRRTEPYVEHDDGQARGMPKLRRSTD